MERNSSSFHVTVNKNAVAKPLLESREVSSIEIRDEYGKLMILIAMVPNHPVLMVSAADKDTDFGTFCEGLGFKLTKQINEK
jgi:hypothetical protein